jgi:hypothetical protein
VVRLATASVLAGMAVAASAGTAAAAPAAPLPAFTGTTSLEALLVTDREAGNMLGVRDLDEVRSGNKLGTGTVRPSQCISAYSAAMAASYADTDPKDVSFKVLSDEGSGTGMDLIVTEAVAQLDSKRDALAHMTATAEAWADCKGMTVTAGGDSWVLGAPRVNDARTIVTLAQTSVNGGSTCERAIATYRDVFIDVMSCSTGRAEGQAVKITRAIADNADAQSI